jgi:N-acetylmuramoyl-L-alanine amidase
MFCMQQGFDRLCGNARGTIRLQHALGIFVVAALTALLMAIAFPSQAHPVNVWVDAGHGGSDPGAVYSGVPRVEEKTLNLAVSLIVRDELQKMTIPVGMTRTTDTYVSLADRVHKAKTWGAELFVSIHHNASVSSSARGIETLYSAAKPINGVLSARLARLVQNEMIAATSMPDRGVVVRDGLYVLANSGMPAIIVEGGFISNSQDRARITTSTYQRTLGRAVARGVKAFIDEGHLNAPTPQLPGSTRYEQNVEMLRYSGSWSSWANPGLSGGSYSHTQTGAAAFRFFGTRFAWVTARSAGSGMGRVTIERVSTSGVRETVTTSPVDLYSPAVAYQQRVFDSGALTPAYYEVRIEGTGSGAVGIDAIDVLGAMVLPGAFIHEQHSHLIGYAGPWTTWSDGRLSAGSYAWSDDPAAEAAFSFSGTRFRWVTATGPSMGTARVYVDGKLHKTVSLKSASTQFQRVVLDTGTIPTGTRTVRIEPVGDGPVGIDRLEVTGSMNPAPAPLSWTPHEQTSVHIAYAGNWTRWTDTNMYGGSHDWSHSSLASAGLAHTGTRFRWFATTAPTYGTADVYMNGTYTATVSLKSQTLAYRQLVYDSGTLPEATRVVTIVPRGDGPVSLDRFSVLGTLGSPPQLPEWRSAEQDSGAIGYAGTWTTWNNSELSKGSYAWSESSAARAVFRFSGTRARWVTVTGPKMGSASVYVNGVLQQTVSLKSSTLAYRRIVFDTGQLPEGTHEVAIVPVGDGPVGVDRVDVSGQFLAPLDAEGFKLIEQTHPALTYAGAWTTWANAALSGGSYVWANSTVAEASFAFTGTRARWVTVTGPSMGSARVYVNGALRSTISLKSAALTYQSVVFDTGMLHDTTHTVTIVPVGDGPVGVDRVEVLGEVDVP